MIENTIRFHGHQCPGLAAGIRVSEVVLRELGKPAKDEEMVAIVENNSCGVDAIQLLTGCTFGKGNLIFRDFGKSVYTFINRETNKALRISLNKDTFETDNEHRTLFAKVNEKILATLGLTRTIESYRLYTRTKRQPKLKERYLHKNTYKRVMRYSVCLKTNS